MGGSLEDAAALATADTLLSTPRTLTPRFASADTVAWFLPLEDAAGDTTPGRMAGVTLHSHVHYKEI